MSEEYQIFKVYYWFGSHQFETIVKAVDREHVMEHFMNYKTTDIVIVKTDILDLTLKPEQIHTIE